MLEPPPLYRTEYATPPPPLPSPGPPPADAGGQGELFPVVRFLLPGGGSRTKLVTRKAFEKNVYLKGTMTRSQVNTGKGWLGGGEAGSGRRGRCGREHFEMNFHLGAR